MSKTGDAAVEQALRQFGPPLAPPDVSAPSKSVSIPDWNEARIVISNAGTDNSSVRSPTPLDRFVYDYDDTDPERSKKFMADLQTLVKWSQGLPMRMDSPWSLPEVLGKLIEATEHLLGHHSCDAHGHELYRAAANAGRSILHEWQNSGPETGVKSDD